MPDTGFWRVRNPSWKLLVFADSSTSHWKRAKRQASCVPAAGGRLSWRAVLSSPEVGVVGQPQVHRALRLAQLWEQALAPSEVCLPPPGGRAHEEGSAPAPWMRREGQGHTECPLRNTEGKESWHLSVLEPVSQWAAPEGQRKSGKAAWGGCKKTGERTALGRC